LPSPLLLFLPSPLCSFFCSCFSMGGLSSFFCNLRRCCARLTDLVSVFCQHPQYPSPNTIKYVSTTPLAPVPSNSCFCFSPSTDFVRGGLFPFFVKQYEFSICLPLPSSITVVTMRTYFLRVFSPLSLSRNRVLATRHRGLLGTPDVKDLAFLLAFLPVFAPPPSQSLSVFPITPPATTLSCCHWSSVPGSRLLSCLFSSLPSLRLCESPR